MSLFDAYRNCFEEMRGTPASNITHTVSGWSDESSENGSGMVNGLLAMLAQLEEEKDGDVRTAGVICGVGGFSACAILCGVAYWLKTHKDQKKQEKEYATIKKVKQEVQAVERVAEMDKERIAEGKQSEQQVKDV